MIFPVRISDGGFVCERSTIFGIDFTPAKTIFVIEMLYQTLNGFIDFKFSAAMFKKLKDHQPAFNLKHIIICHQF